MFLHNLLQSHIADPKGNHWEGGLFVSICEICRQPMVKQPGGQWALRAKWRRA